MKAPQGGVSNGVDFLTTGAAAIEAESPASDVAQVRRDISMNIAMALVGVALIIGGIIWRLKSSGFKGQKRRPRSSKRGASTGSRSSVDAQSALFPAGEGDSSTLQKGVIDWSQAPTTVPRGLVRSQRNSELILLKIPVDVSGTTVEDEAFTERTFTLAVGRNGAHISLRTSPQPGRPITITNIGTRQSRPFRLCDADADLAGDLVAWGVECLEPAPDFWQIRFPEILRKPQTQDNITALIECGSCHASEMAELTALQYHDLAEKESMTRECPTCKRQTGWIFRFIDESSEDEFAPALEAGGSKGQATTGAENRLDRRILVKLPIRIRHQDGRLETTLTENVSISGVSCAAYTDWQVGDAVLLTFESVTGGREEETPSRIMWRRAMIVNGKTLYGIKLDMNKAFAQIRPGSREAMPAERSRPSTAVSASVHGSGSGAPAENTRAQLAPRPERGGSAASLFQRGTIDWSQASSTIPSVVAQSRRDNDGILLKIPVEVSGTTVDGEVFTERTFTLAVARNGAYISLRSSPRPGRPITITNIGTRQSRPFRLGDSDAGLAGDMVAWGVECIEPAPDFWQIRFPEILSKPQAQDNITALIECSSCHASEMAELTATQYHSLAEIESITRQCPTCQRQTEWRFRSLDDSPGDKFLPTMEANSAKGHVTTGAENRIAKRVLVKLPVTIRHHDGRMETTVTENVSISGVCCAASSDWRAGDSVLLTFESVTGAKEEETPSRIMWRRAMIVKGKTLYGIRLEMNETAT